MNINKQLGEAIKTDLGNIAKGINSFWTRFFCLFDKDMREQRKRIINTINSMLEDLK